MSDINIKNQFFGVEVELSGLTRKDAAFAIAELFESCPGYVGRGYDTWTVDDNDGKTWKLVYDSSIHAQKKEGNRYVATNDHEYKVELVSPKLSYDEMPKLQEVIRCLRHAGARSSQKDGIHIHLDGANHNRQSLKNFLGIMYSKEDLLFKAVQVNERRAEQWCDKVREPMLLKARKLSSDETKDLTKLEDIWYEGIGGRTERYSQSRYAAVNLHSMFYKGTVEVRIFNSTTHAGKIKAYADLCLAMSAQAIKQRSTVMRKTKSDNELFTFRVWLVRLGLNGEEFKNTRDHLLANLSGDRAWRRDKDSYECNKQKKKTKNRETER